MSADLVVERPEGLYCPPGDFYIDPWRPVARPVVTHAHADHARGGHAHYLAAAPGAGVLRARLGAIALQTLAYGEAIDHHGVRLSLHPAGHVLGSAQVRLEHGGRVWVVSGDYYLSGAGDDNLTCAPFEPLRCDCFVTESTFGLPIYRWRPQREVYAEIDAWWAANAAAGRPSLLLGYSFGKAQRLLAGVDAAIGPVFVHGAVEPLNRAYREAGVALPPTRLLNDATDKASSWRAPSSSLALGAALGLVGVWAYAGVRLATDPASASGAAREPLPRLSTWRVLREDPIFARYLGWQFLLGVSNMMIEPAVVYAVSREMGAGYGASIAIVTVVPNALSMLTLPLWAG